MAQRGNTPGTISNAISHLRTFYKLAGLPDAPLHHYRVGLALRAIAITIRYKSAKKQPATPRILKKALAHIMRQPDALPVRLAILFMFIGFMRQSSVAPSTSKRLDPARHITCEDVEETSKGLSVRLKWTKTHQRSTDAETLLLPSTRDTDLCPVNAYRACIAKHPAPRPQAPLITFADGNAMPVRTIAKSWAAAVKAAGADPLEISLHSLRKGGASYAYNVQKATLNDVMTQGTWRSLAVRDYIKPRDLTKNTVHRALERL